MSTFEPLPLKTFCSNLIELFGHSYPLHRVLQIGFSIFALPVLAWMIYRHHLHYRTTVIVNRWTKMYVYVLGLLSLLAGILSYLYFADSVYSDAFVHDLYAYTGKSINYFFRAFLAVFTVGSLIFVILKSATNIFKPSVE